MNEATENRSRSLGDITLWMALLLLVAFLLLLVAGCSGESGSQGKTPGGQTYQGETSQAQPSQGQPSQGQSEGTKNGAGTRASEASTALDSIGAHYVLISEHMDDRVWQDLFEDLYEIGLTRGAYVECLPHHFPDDYSTADYMKIAIAAGVDGIFVEGREEGELKDLITKAQNAGIPVMTLMTDCEESQRQCYIETSSFTLGYEYGKQLCLLASEQSGSHPAGTGQPDAPTSAAGSDQKQQVLLLAGDQFSGSRLSLLISGIVESLGEAGIAMDLETAIVTGDFGAARIVREHILNSEEAPDIILCLTERDTLEVYQILVDYNVIGQIGLIGSAISETMLDAVRLGSIQALILPDTQAMALQAITAMDTWREQHRVTEYIAAEPMILDLSSLSPPEERGEDRYE